MPTDSELLRVYAETKSEEAFRELVQRHHRMVFYAALRKLGGDVHRAQEVAQDVFADLGRKAAKLARRPVIQGWLYVSACYAAAKAARTAHRKRLAEERAAAMEQISKASRSEVDQAELNPVLDEMLLQLSPRDREAVLLRFFDGLTFSEMAAKLELSEDGARLRLNRAVEKMRTSLARRGVVSSATALSGILASQAQAAAPGGLASTVASGALQELSRSAAGAVYISIMTKSTVSIVCAAVLIGTIPAVYFLRSGRSPFASSDGFSNQGSDPIDAAKHLIVVSSGASGSAASRSVAATSTPSAEKTSAVPADPKTALYADLSRGSFRSEALANLGGATPRTAVESFLWAIARGSNDDIASMLALTESQKEKIQALLKTLPAEARTKYVDPEHLVALFGAREGTVVPPSGTIDIDSETLAASDEVKITAHMTTTPDQYSSSGLSPNNSSDFDVRNGPTGWKVVVPDYAIDQIVSRVTPSVKQGG